MDQKSILTPLGLVTGPLALGRVALRDRRVFRAIAGLRAFRYHEAAIGIHRLRAFPAHPSLEAE